MRKCLLEIFYRFSFAFEMLRLVAKYLLITVILLIGIQKQSYAFSKHTNSFSNQEENIFESINIENVFFNEQILKPCSQNSEGTIDVEPTFIEEDENEDEDENISHKKLKLKNSSAIALIFAPTLPYSQSFFKKHLFSYFTQYQTLTNGKYKVLGVFRL